jgi:hypothetical protein
MPDERDAVVVSLRDRRWPRCAFLLELETHEMLSEFHAIATVALNVLIGCVI